MSRADPGSYAVRFVPLGARSGSGFPYDGARGAGRIAFASGGVRLYGRARRALRLARQVDVTIPYEAISNARSIGREVVFEIGTTAGSLRLKLRAGDPRSADAILRRLPTRQSADFAQALGELDLFRRRLDIVSPHARVTPVLVGLNVLVFAGMVLQGAGRWSVTPDIALRWGSNFGWLTRSGQWWRLLSSTFVHFGLLHIGLNMLALSQAGREVERIYGSPQFLLLYLVAGISGSLASAWWHPAVNSAGASGAIFGVIGALGVFMLLPGTQVPKSLVSAQLRSTLLILALNLANGFSIRGIDNAAHLGGLLGGSLMGLLLARPLDPAHRQRGAGRLILAGVAALLVIGLLIALLPPLPALPVRARRGA